MFSYARLVAVSWLVGLLLSVAPAQAVDLAAARPTSSMTDPKLLVEELTQTVLLTLDRERGEIRRNPLRIYEVVGEIIAPHVDTHQISKLVLGRHWTAATPAQRRRFRLAMASRIVQTLVTGISQYVDVNAPRNTKIRFLATRRSGDSRDVTVRSRFGGNGAPSIRVDYRLHHTDGGWKFYDLAIAGSSLVLTYRRDYIAEVERSGLDRLIELVSVDTPGAYRAHRPVGKSAIAGS